MKKIILTVTLFISFGCLTFGQNIEPVNAVVGDAGFLWKFDRLPTDHDVEIVRISAHLEYVEAKLRASTPEGLTTEQARNRQKNLDHLHKYRTAGQFPQNLERQGRTPCFIDPNGQICAVGYLLEQSKGRDFAESINAQFQYASVFDMDDPELGTWVANSGLSLQECAMIQPAYGEPNFYNRYAPPRYANKSEAMEDRITWQLRDLPKKSLRGKVVCANFEIGIAGNLKDLTLTGDLEEETYATITGAIRSLTFKPGTYGGKAIACKGKIILNFAEKGGTYPSVPESMFEFDRKTPGVEWNPADPNATEITFSGVLIDHGNDEPLIGAYVILEGTTSGVATDIDGKFSITVPGPRESFTIRFRYFGFRDKVMHEIPFSDQELTVPMMDERAAPESANFLRSIYLPQN